MDCDSDSPNANETACLEIQSKFLDTTGLAEMPCGAGTGEPPTRDFACPCDFAADTWRELLTDGTYPYPGCKLTARPGTDDLELSVSEDQQVRWDTNRIELLSGIVLAHEPVYSTYLCYGVKHDEILGSQFQPRPFGAIELHNYFENEILPIQLDIHQACKRDLETLISDVFPGLECIEDIE